MKQNILHEQEMTREIAHDVLQMLEQELALPEQQRNYQKIEELTRLFCDAKGVSSELNHMTRQGVRRLTHPEQLAEDFTEKEAPEAVPPVRLLWLRAALPAVACFTVIFGIAGLLSRMPRRIPTQAPVPVQTEILMQQDTETVQTSAVPMAEASAQESIHTRTSAPLQTTAPPSGTEAPSTVPVQTTENSFSSSLETISTTPETVTEVIPLPEDTASVPPSVAAPVSTPEEPVSIPETIPETKPFTPPETVPETQSVSLPDYAEAYLQICQQYETYQHTEHALFDLIYFNGDDIPELLVMWGDHDGYLFRYADGAAEMALHMEPMESTEAEQAHYEYIPYQAKLYETYTLYQGLVQHDFFVDAQLSKNFSELPVTHFKVYYYEEQNGNDKPDTADERAVLPDPEDFEQVYTFEQPVTCVLIPSTFYQQNEMIGYGFPVDADSAKKYYDGMGYQKMTGKYDYEGLRLHFVNIS